MLLFQDFFLDTKISPACHTCVLQPPQQCGDPRCAHYLSRSIEYCLYTYTLFTWNPSMRSQSVGNSHLGADVLSVSRVAVEVTLHVTLARHDSGNVATFLLLLSVSFLWNIYLFLLTTVTPLRCEHMKNVISSLKKYTCVSYLDICCMDANYQ